MTCLHEEFDAKVGVGRLTSEEGGPVTGYIAEIRISCLQCGKPFQFLGLEPGIDLQGARVSIDALEAHIALVPEGEKPSPLQRMAFNISKFDG